MTTSRARREQQGFEHLRHGRVTHRRTRADYLGRHSSRMRQGKWLAQDVVEILIDVGHPVAREQELILPGDGTLEAHHGVHPRGELRLDEKFGIGAVLAAAVSDAIVNHHDLAMVAKVDSTMEGAQQQTAYRQARGRPHASRTHRLPVLGADDRARTEVIGHGPTGHTAGGRALQRLDNLQTVVIGQPDIEQYMDVILCAVDVGHHRVDHGIGVGHQLRSVAADGVETADRAAQLKDMPVTLGDVGCKRRRVLSEMTGERWHAPENGVQPLHATTADVHLAQEQIGEHAQQREHANDHYPCDSGRGGAMRPKQDSRDHRQLEQREESNGNQRVTERIDHGYP